MVKTTSRKHFRSAFKQIYSPRHAVQRSPIPPVQTGTPKAAAAKRVSAFSNRSKLSTLCEESPAHSALQGSSTPRRHGRTRLNMLVGNVTARREPELEDTAGGGSDDSSDSDSDFDGWDDETTLVARFHDNVPELNKRDKLEALAESLEAPMDANGAALRQYLAHTIAPAAKRVKDIHSKCEQSVDVAFGISVLSFDDACQRVEKMALKDEDEIRTAYLKTQRNVKEILRQLNEAYQRRDELWIKLKDSIDESASRTMSAVTSLPAELDETISEIEKKAKEFSRGSALDGKAKQKILRELLAAEM